MATLKVQPRQTPGERAGTQVDVDVDDRLAAFAAILEEWAEPRQGWSLTLREGHDFGRANNVVAVLVFAGGEQFCSLTFRLDQLDGVEEIEYDALLRFEERDGIAKTAMLTASSLQGRALPHPHIHVNARFGFSRTHATTHG